MEREEAAEDTKKEESMNEDKEEGLEDPDAKPTFRFDLIGLLQQSWLGCSGTSGPIVILSRIPSPIDFDAITTRSAIDLQFGTASNGYSQPVASCISQNFEEGCPPRVDTQSVVQSANPPPRSVLGPTPPLTPAAGVNEPADAPDAAAAQ